MNQKPKKKADKRTFAIRLFCIILAALLLIGSSTIVITLLIQKMLGG
ncbi:MAG: hypothetical protein II710_02830 [Clostridia bacterium]|nr:hypothetical protein [Clostridia bacterium]MBQ3927560.1 hypothetical protein [Clostridia bacterium]